MNIFDPTAPDTNDADPADRDWSIDEIVELQNGETDHNGHTANEDVLTPARIGRMQPGTMSATDSGNIVEQREVEGKGTRVHPPAEAFLPLHPVLKRATRGRYMSPMAAFQLELRVDIDGKRPMRRISGDFHRSSGATISYFGSFVVHSPTLTVTPSMVRIDGVGLFTYATYYPRIRVTIPRVSLLTPPAPATVQFFSKTNEPGATDQPPFYVPT